MNTSLLAPLLTMPATEAARVVAQTPALREHLRIQPSEITRTGVACPVIQDEIVVPCDLKACVFHTDLDRCHHCALVYSHTHSEDFGVVDLAILYRKPTEAMQALVDSAIASMQTEMHSDKEVVFVFAPLEGVCTCCESPIEGERVRVQDLDYCSDRCARRLPPENAWRGYLPTT